MALREKLKSVVQRAPAAFHSVRDIRDILRLDSLTPLQTRYGFSFIGSGAMQEKSYGHKEGGVVSQLLRSHDIFMDIGANVGYFSCLARSQGKTVLSFEPVRTNLYYLYKNIELNNWTDRIEVYPVALGEKAGCAPIYGARCGSSLVAGWSGGSKSHEVVSVLPLDSIVQQRFNSERILCKLDVEGFEYQCLLGAQDLLSRSVAPTWLVEIFLDRGHATGLNSKFVETFSLFFKCGYSCFAEGDKNAPVSHDQVRHWQHDQQGLEYTNYLFTRFPEEL